MCGVRNNYDVKDAMLTNSLFKDFLDENGLDVYEGKSTRDIICIEFNYGSRSYQEEQKNCKKIIKLTEAELAKTDDKYLTVKLNEKLKRLNELLEFTNNNQDKYKKKNKQDIRTLFYNEGVTIKYPIFGRDKKIKSFDEIHYKMLYRTPGKAKKGSCMFIRDSLYDKAREFLYMGIQLPKQNAPIVEIGAYSSLITSSIVDRVQIKPEEIFIFKEMSFEFKTDVINVGAENRKCFAKFEKDHVLTNDIFDGQALIDSSIFPKDGNGYILLRQHFFKAAAFKTNIQTFFKDYYGDKYDTAIISDMFGIKHRVKDIKLITTNNACKWIKFDGITFDYWCDWLSKNDYKFGIVKTAHESKFGDVQRMSYQMINALDEKTMDSVLSKSKEYITALKTDDETFFKYLKDNINFSNDFEALLAICEKCPDFVRSDYFRERKKNIIYSYVLNLKNGKVIQNADNLTIVGSPYAMLLNTVGENPQNDPTFKQESEAIQCWTERFNNEEYLAEFRNPFNSRNNLGYLHNVYHEYFDKYFDFGKLIIAVNSLGSCFMDRNNGLI